MDGSTHGPKPVFCQITGVDITKFPKFHLTNPQLGGMSERTTTFLHLTWKTRILFTHRWKIPHRYRSINWPRCFGTFSTLTGMEIVAFWNDWKTLMEIFHCIRFRFMDQKIWPTLPAIWQPQLKHWLIKHMQWLQWRIWMTNFLFLAMWMWIWMWSSLRFETPAFSLRHPWSGHL